MSPLEDIHLRECSLYRCLNPAKDTPSDLEVSTKRASTKEETADSKIQRDFNGFWEILSDPTF